MAWGRKVLEIITREGERIIGADALTIAHRLWASAHVKAPSLSAFMAETAQRAKDQNGARVRTARPEDFIADLIGAGLLQRIN